MEITVQSKYFGIATVRASARASERERSSITTMAKITLRLPVPVGQERGRCEIPLPYRCRGKQSRYPVV